MIEVEVKTKVDNFNQVRDLLKKKAKLVSLVNQKDAIFGLGRFLDDEHQVIEGGIIARIREKDDFKKLEFKEISRKKGGIELKAEIDNVSLVKKFLISKLDFQEAFTIKKKRETYVYKGFKICLDSVVQLGKFIEVEKTVKNYSERAKARKDCINILNELVPGAELENKKYGDLMQEIINKSSMKM